MSPSAISGRRARQVAMDALAGGTFGLCLARCLAEALPHAWRWWQLLPFGLVLLAIGGALGLVLARRWQMWPLGLSLIYVLWPWPAAWPAILVAVASTVLWVAVNGLLDHHTTWHEIAIALLALGLYLSTLAPGLLPADAGEFQIVASTLGIAHPPGYPLYTLLGRLVVFIPLHSPAWRVNLFAALCAAGCVGIVARVIGRQTGSGLLAVLTSAALMVTPTFWVQGTGANIRSLTVLLVALGLAQALRWERTRTARDLTLLGLVLGLGVGHHASIGLLLPAFLAFILLAEPVILRRPRQWLGAVGAALSSLVVIAYLPLRSAMEPIFAPSGVGSWSELVSHVLALGFSGDMLRYTAWSDLWRRAGALAQILRLEHGAVMLSLAAVATTALCWQRWRVAVLIAGVWLLNVLAAITYRAPQTVEYIMPSYVALALVLGLGLHALSRRMPVRHALLVVTAVGVVNLGAASWSGMRALHQDDDTRTRAQDLLRAAPPNALILAGWHQATPLWYLTMVEGERPDVTVTYVFPEGATPNADVWLRRTREALGQRPVVVTNRFHAYATSDLWFEPLADGWLVRAAPARSDAIGVATFGNALRLDAWQLQSSEATPGATLRLDVTLAALTSVEQDYTLFAQLLGPDGVVAQDDRLVRTSRLQRGDTLVERLQPTLLLDCAPGDYQLVIGLYAHRDGIYDRLHTASGEVLALTSVQVRPLRQPTISAHPVAHRFSNGLQLLGLDVDKSVPGQQRLYMHVRTDAAQTTPITLIASNTAGAEVARATITLPSRGNHALVAVDLPVDLRRMQMTVLQGEAAVRLLGPWHRDAGNELWLDLTRYGERYVPLEGEMALTNWRGHCEEGICRVQAEFVAQRPLTTDYSISLGIRGATTESKSDGTPVTGAVPTLKWLAGWRVRDARSIPALNERAERGILTVYDAFTLRTLQVLDDRLVLDGQGTELSLPIP